MLLAPYADMSLIYIFMWSVIYGFFAFVCVMLLEAFILFAMKWGGALNSLRDSFLINLITTIMGAVLLNIFGSFISDLGYTLSMILFWALSLLVEGCLLYLLSKHSLMKSFQSSTIANICSYVLVYFLILTDF